MSVVEELSGDGSRIVTSWKRTTVADGDWLQHNTIGPLNERDVFLAEKIDELSGNADEKLNEEIEARKNADTFLSGTIDTFSGNYETFKSKTEGNIDYLSGSIDGLKEDLDTEKEDRSREDGLLQDQIDTIKAASDVIMVYGTYNNFETNSASLTLTDNDVIKVLEDEHLTPPGQQVYYQYSENTKTWTNIGELSPYYSKSEIDDKETELSSTIANTYLSANGTDISAGKNLDVVIQSNNPRVAFKTKDDVSFSSVSAKGFSGTNLSGLNQNDTIDNLFGSAYSGAEASAWIYANSAILDIQPGYGLTYDINELGNKVIGLHQDHCDYYGHSLALGSYSTANGDNSYAFGMSCVTIGGAALAIGDNARATTGAVALGTYNSAMGKYSLALGYNTSANNQFSVAIGRGLSGEAPITLGTWNDNVAGATFIIGDGTGTQEGHDVVRKNALVIKDGLVSGRDFSAGDVSLSSLTNISAFGNGITNTATFNLSAVKLSAGQGIGFKNDTNGVLSITAEGTTYNAGTYISTANKTISVTNDLVNSAKSGWSAYDTVKNSATLSAGFGIQFTSADTTAMGIKLQATINADDKIAYIGGKALVGGGISSISVPGAVFTGLNVNFSAGDNIDFTTANNKLTIDLHNNLTLGETASKQIYIFTKDEGEVEIDSDGPEIVINNTSQSQLHLYNNKIVRDGNSTTWDKVIRAGNQVAIVVGSTGTDLNTLYIY